MLTIIFLLLFSDSLHAMMLEKKEGRLNHLKQRIISVQELQETYKEEAYNALLNNGNTLHCTHTKANEFRIIEHDNNGFNALYTFSWNDSLKLFKFLQQKWCAQSLQALKAQRQ